MIRKPCVHDPFYLLYLFLSVCGLYNLHLTVVPVLGSPDARAVSGEAWPAARLSAAES